MLLLLLGLLWLLHGMLRLLLRMLLRVLLAAKRRISWWNLRERLLHLAHHGLHLLRIKPLLVRVTISSLLGILLHWHCGGVRLYKVLGSLHHRGTRRVLLLLLLHGRVPLHDLGVHGGVHPLLHLLLLLHVVLHLLLLKDLLLLGLEVR